MIENVQTHRCPRCDAAIATECVAGNIMRIKHIGEPTRRIVRVWCDHCSALFKGTFKLSGALWELEDQPQEVTDTREKESFMKRLDHVRGDQKRVARSA